MNLSLDNNVNKLVLLLVVGVVVLLLINMNKKCLGESVATVLSIGVIVVCGFFGNQLLNEPEETFVNPNESNAPTYEDYEEHFQNNNAEAEDEAEAEAEAEAALEAAQAEAANNAANATRAANNAARAAANAAANAEAANNAANVPANNVPANNVSANNGSELNAEDLLPESSNSVWAESAPNNNGSLNSQSLLNAGHHIGVNTTGCSMRNANRGIRSEPPNPQVQVSPWLQTTICPDLYRKPLDCGFD
jgi:hypothetical protein